MQPNLSLRLLPLSLCCSLALACSDDPKLPRDEAPHEDAGDPEPEPEPDAGADPDAGEPVPAVFGGLEVNTTPEAQTLDLFGKVGHRVWLEVSQEQVDLMNAERPIIGPWLEAKAKLAVPSYRVAEPDVGIPIDPGPGGSGGDIYTPGLEEDSTFVDHVVIQDVETKSVADYGKLEVALVGSSTFRNWTKKQIPNFRVDTNEFQPGLRIDGFEHFRLNNAVIGTIFREHLAYRVFQGLGYPAARSSFVFLGSSYWGEDVWIPMVLVESYKRKFCTDNQALLGGTCKNMWEFPGDAGDGFLPDDACQVGKCDNTRMEELAAAIAEAPKGEGFKVALADIVDWQRYHEYQCIGWMLSTWDDAVRVANNNLIIERENDKRLVWAPYSVDISAGGDILGGGETPLLGQARLAQGCQLDPDCWEDVYAVCEDLIEKFEKLKPEKFVDEVEAELTKHGMMRAGDTERAEFLRTWYAERGAYVRSILPRYRYLPDAEGQCPDDLVACNDGGCGTEEECLERRCGPTETWCEQFGQCIPSFDVCPSCDTPEAPLFCAADHTCVADVDACSDICKTWDPTYIYCESTKQCMRESYCQGDGEPDPEPLPAFSAAH